MRIAGMRLRTLGWAMLFCSSGAMAQASDPLPLTPLPQSVVRGAGSFTVSDGAAIGTAPEDKGAQAAARVLAAHVRVERGLVLSPRDGAGAITLARDASIRGDEAYRLVVDARGIRISASGDRGLLYGAMTVAQLLSPDRRFGTPVKVPAVTIEDAPRFGWRGLMLDVARHYQPIEAIYAVVDQMVSVKLNTLHLHLTDDQGWRFEVKRYPKLTELGAWRTPPSTGGAPGARVGGFYTQEQLKALVAYAAARGITIVPEIDLPGHAQALVAAYPELGVFGDRPGVSHDWGVNPYLLNPDPKGVAFVKQVLDELMAVFPGTYIDLGGDEAIKDQWQRSPQVQAQIKALGLKDEDQLQSWLIDEFGNYLAAKGRRLIGWDEILEGGLPASASVMSWRGEKGAVDAANQNHDVVLSPAPTLYFDSLQSDRADEPPGRLSIQTLADVYKYEPMPAGIDAGKASHVLGAQANAWSEYLVTPYQVQHMLFPRAAALAEITWSAKDKRNFADFLTRLDPQIQRWRRSGVEVADSAFAVGFRLEGTRGDALRTNRVRVALVTQAPYGTIRYTLDGTAPGATSPAYKAPLELKPGVTIRAAAFDAADQATAWPRSFDTGRTALLTRTSSDLVACPHGAFGLRVPLTSEATDNAPVFNVNLFDTCSAYPKAPLDIAKSFVIDVARLPRHYGLAHEAKALREHYNVTAYGELVVVARCIAAAKDKTIEPVVLATFPLPDPATAPTRFSVAGVLPAMGGDEDICFQFTAPLAGPYYAVERAVLSEVAK
ncbi:beta-N-acetylhexosaminidase [Sphingomonas asaccharolytica]|uniref:beta-N-acetylhexosaminidase n=1 Tax=Sphingomonas asaccharolytica TaxID=40681 RepID=UPI00082D9DCC|nr:family 20 glycosylhydrolase [Sphingomonas asaccharolytica]